MYRSYKSQPARFQYIWRTPICENQPKHQALPTIWLAMINTDFCWLHNLQLLTILFTKHSVVYLFCKSALGYEKRRNSSLISTITGQLKSCYNMRNTVCMMPRRQICCLFCFLLKNKAKQLLSDFIASSCLILAKLVVLYMFWSTTLTSSNYNISADYRCFPK